MYWVFQTRSHTWWWLCSSNYNKMCLISEGEMVPEWPRLNAKRLTYCMDSLKTFTILNEAIHSFGIVPRFKASDSTGYFAELLLYNNNESQWVRFYAIPLVDGLHSFPFFRLQTLTVCTMNWDLPSSWRCPSMDTVSSPPMITAQR